jgi:hypothetical protein
MCSEKQTMQITSRWVLSWLDTIQCNRKDAALDVGRCSTCVFCHIIMSMSCMFLCKLHQSVTFIATANQVVYSSAWCVCFFSQFLYTTERHCGPIMILVFLHTLLLTNALDRVCAIITNVNCHSYNNFVVLSVGILETSSSIGGMMLEPQMFANIAICVMLPIHCGPFFFRPLHFWTFSIQPIVILCLRWFQIFRVYVLHSFHFRLEFKSIVVHSTHRCDVSQVCDYTGICFCLLMVFCKRTYDFFVASYKT